MSQSSELNSLLETVDHLIRISEKIERLQNTREQTIQQIIQSARRTEIDYETALDLYGKFKRHGIPVYRVLHPFGWTHHALFVLKEALPMRGVHVVYALISGSEVIYVGRSMNVKQRLITHKKNMNFDRVETYRCESAKAAADLEAVLQQQHHPKHNRRIEKRTAA